MILTYLCGWEISHFVLYEPCGPYLQYCFHLPNCFTFAKWASQTSFPGLLKKLLLFQNTYRVLRIAKTNNLELGRIKKPLIGVWIFIGPRHLPPYYPSLESNSIRRYPRTNYVFLKRNWLPRTCVNTLMSSQAFAPISKGWCMIEPDVCWCDHIPVLVQHQAPSHWLQNCTWNITEYQLGADFEVLCGIDIVHLSFVFNYEGKPSTSRSSLLARFIHPHHNHENFSGPEFIRGFINHIPLTNRLHTATCNLKL